MSLDDKEVGKISCGTTVFRWEIENFFALCNNVKRRLNSPIFYAGNAKWCLQLYPKGDGLEYEDYISLNLALVDVCQLEDEVYVERLNFYTVEVDNKDLGRELLHKCGNTRNCKFTSNKRSWGEPQFLVRKHLRGSEILKDDKLTILCESSSIVCNIKKSYFKNMPENCNSFEKFVNNEEFSDVKFTIGDKTLFAHKTILSNKSDVFTAMFRHGMSESQSNTIEIEDIDYDVLLEFLKFIYTGKFNLNEEMAKELAIVADKYAVIDLGIICEKYLCRSVSISNVVEYLDFADTHNLSKLKKQAIEFITDNAKAIVQDTSQYKSMKDLDSSILVDVFQSLALKK